MTKILASSKEKAEKVGLPFDPDISVFYVWVKKKKKVYFSASKRGTALEIHLATVNGKYYLEEAVSDLCDFLFKNYEWCTKIVGIILKESVINLARRCGFKVFGKVSTKRKGKPVTFTLVKRER